MAEGRARLEWRQTAAQMALLANINRPRNKAAFTTDSFDPFAEIEDTGMGADALLAFMPPGYVPPWRRKKK